MNFSLNTTFTIEDLLIWVLLLVAIIAVIYLIVLLSKVIKIAKPAQESVEKIDKMLDDVQICVTNIKDGSEEVKKTLNKTSDTLRSVTRILDANRGPISALSGIANAGASLASLVGIKRRKRK